MNDILIVDIASKCEQLIKDGIKKQFPDHDNMDDEMANDVITFVRRIMCVFTVNTIIGFSESSHKCIAHNVGLCFQDILLGIEAYKEHSRKTGKN